MSQSLLCAQKVSPHIPLSGTEMANLESYTSYLPTNLPYHLGGVEGKKKKISRSQFPHLENGYKHSICLLYSELR